MNEVAVVQDFIRDNDLGIDHLTLEEMNEIVALLELVNQVKTKQDLDAALHMMDQCDVKVMVMCVILASISFVNGAFIKAEELFKPLVKKAIIYVNNARRVSPEIRIPQDAYDRIKLRTEWNRWTLYEPKPRKTQLLARYECPTCGHVNDFLVSQNAALPKHKYCNMVCWRKKRSRFKERWSMKDGFRDT